MKIDENAVISLIDSKYANDALYLIEHLKKKEIPYNQLKNNKVMQATLTWILKHKGYTYLSDKIYRLFNKREVDYKKVYDTLINGQIINESEIAFSSDIDFQQGIKFKKKLGIKKRYFIKLNQDKYPFKIKYISNEYRGYVNVAFENKEFYNYINIEINIPPNINYPIDIQESIIIYTDYKVKVFDINIMKLDDIVEKNYDLRIMSSMVLMKERTRRIVTVYKWLDRLNYKDNMFTVSHLRNIKNRDIIFEVFRRYRNSYRIENNKLKIEEYLRFINDFLNLEEIDIKGAYLIEEFISEYALVTNLMKNYLEKIYNAGYVSTLTEEVIGILKMTDVRLDIKKKFNILDSETLADFKKGNISIEMASKILKTKGIKYDYVLTKIMYDFYKETDDINALKMVIKNKGKNNFKIKDGDVVSLINKRKEGIQIEDRIVLLAGKEFENHNRYIREEMDKIKQRVVIKS